MKELDSWSSQAFDYNGESRPVYRKGHGTGVIIIHEIPGIEPSLLRFAEEVVARGHTVWLPQLFGTPGAGVSFSNIFGEITQFCVRREFSIFARGKTSPVAGWLRGLARTLHEQAGGEGVGVVGMCFTGGFALAMMADAPVIAPVLSQPSMPVSLGKTRAADLGLSHADLQAVRAKTTAGCQVLGLKYREDTKPGTKFDTLRHELGEKFLAVELEGKAHSVLTEDRDDAAVIRVLDFFDEKLDGKAPVRERDGALEDALRGSISDAIDVVVTRTPPRAHLVVRGPLEAERRSFLHTTAQELVGSPPLIEVRG
ncbi:dienelactone hydrolase family protein (plasmid) [Coraliomargarita sp. W4R53]